MQKWSSRATQKQKLKEFWKLSDLTMGNTGHLSVLVGLASLQLCLIRARRQPRLLDLDKFLPFLIIKFVFFFYFINTSFKDF